MILAFSAFVASASLATASFQRALDSSAEWTMERTLPGAVRPLVSSGTVQCRKGEGIVWTTKSPFEASVEMTTNYMAFADEEGRRVKALAALPHYAELRDATDAFVAGKTDAFEGVFSLQETEDSDGGWRVLLTPEVSAMKRLFVSVEITGAELPTNAVLKTESGGVSVIRFRERERAR